MNTHISTVEQENNQLHQIIARLQGEIAHQQTIIEHQNNLIGLLEVEIDDLSTRLRLAEPYKAKYAVIKRGDQTPYSEYER